MVNDPGGQWIPPQQPLTGPFPQLQPGPMGSPWSPAPAPPRSRGPWIIGGAIVVAAAIVSAAVVLTRPGPSPDPAAAPASDSQTATATTTTMSRSTTSAAAPAGPVYEVVPRTLLPSKADVQRLTGIAMSTFGDPTLTPVPDVNTTPPHCLFAANSVSQSSWKSARAMATQHYLEGAIDSYRSQADAGLAVFASSADAAESLSRVAGSVRGCTALTVPDWNPKLPPANWTVTNIDKGDDHISWTTAGADGQGCRRSYRIQANLAAGALVCGANVSASRAPALTDFLIANATNH